MASRRLRRCLIAALCAVGLGGCAGSSRHVATARTVAVKERDFHISAPREVAAGLVDLSVRNAGPDAHELIVIRGRSAQLPFRTDGITVDEEALERETVGALEPGNPGARRDLTVRLKPGRYVLLCNMSGHYMGGMHTDLVVR